MRLATLAIFSIVLFNLSDSALGQTPGSGDSSSAPALLPALRTTMIVPTHSEPAASALDRSKGQDWHKATLSLLGSMCVTCLMKIEHEIGEIPGVAFIKIERPAPQPAAEATSDTKATATTAGEKARTASTVIIYDNQSVKFDRILIWIKREKYKAIDLQDVEFR